MAGVFGGKVRKSRFLLAPLDRRSAGRYPLDVLGAQTEGMIGYMIEQELGNILPFEQPLATILSMVEVGDEITSVEEALVRLRASVEAL